MARNQCNYILLFNSVSGKMEFPGISSGVSQTCINKLSNDLENHLKGKGMYYERSYYGYPTSRDPPVLGNRLYLQKFIRSLISVANDAYMDLCFRCRQDWQHIGEIHIIGYQTGVYLAIQILRFYVHHKDAYYDDFEEFSMKWSEFLTTERTECENKEFKEQTSKFHISVVAVDPLIPQYTGILPWLFRPRLYKFPLPSLDESPGLAQHTVVIFHEEINRSSEVEVDMLKGLWEAKVTQLAFSDQIDVNAVWSLAKEHLLPQENLSLTMEPTLPDFDQTWPRPTPTTRTTI